MTDPRAYFLTLEHWHLRLVPASEAEVDKAVETLRLRQGLSTIMPHPVLKTLLVPFFRRGWCLAAVEHALRWRPRGGRQPVFKDLGHTPEERDRTRGWLLERQLARWRTKEGEPLPPPVDAESTEDAYRIFREVLERRRRREKPDAAAHARRRETMAALRERESVRLRERRRDRVAAARESDSRIRAVLGELNRMAGLHEADNVEELVRPSWRSAAHRRQQESEQLGAVRSGYLDKLEQLRERARTEGPSVVCTPEMTKVLHGRWRDARTEASIAYLDRLAAGE